MGATAKTIRVALAQIGGGAKKVANLLSATETIRKAKELGAELVILPECFNSPYGTKYFAEYAEEIPNGPTFNVLSDAARDNGVWLIGGTIPEISNGKHYNTCMLFDKNGKFVDKYRKMHLFDIDIPGKVSFHESDVLSAGTKPVHFETEFGKIGLGICYDMRFPELASYAAQKGCFMMVYPGAFTETTGPLHWELLVRARAVDNQMFVAAVSGPPNDVYKAWGHSMLADPMGAVVARAGRDESLVMVDIDLEVLEQTRKSIPVLQQKRYDLYSKVKFTDQ